MGIELFIGFVVVSRVSFAVVSKNLGRVSALAVPTIPTTAELLTELP